MNIKDILMRPVPLYAVVAGLASIGAGSAALTYVLVSKRKDEEYELRLENEIEATKKFYGAIKKPNPVEILQQVIKENDETSELILNDMGYAKISDVKEFYPDVVRNTTEYSFPSEREEFTDEERKVIEETNLKFEEGLVEVSHNVFTDAHIDGWDYEAELESRDPSKPFIISIEEFMQDEDFDKATVTFFDGDGGLVDDRDVLIPDPDKLLGTENLLRFGHGSQDPNIVYVRNVEMQMDYEVVKNPGSYTEQVLGFLKHDDDDVRRRVLKHRVYDY